MTVPAATVADITESDIPEVADFLARNVRSGEAIIADPLPPARRLAWLLLENPARSADIPLGWRIRGAGDAIVGIGVCIPFRMGVRGFSCTALMFAKFFVDPAYRGMGLGLFMRFFREGKRFPLFVSSTNALSGALFSRVGALPIEGMDHTMLGIAGARPLAEEFLHRKLGNGPAARALAWPAGLCLRSRRFLKWLALGKLTRLGSADEAVAIKFPLYGDCLAVVRDRDYLQWRYFKGDGVREVWRFSVADEGDRMLAVNLVRTGYRGQIRVLNVLDLWPPATPSAVAALTAALAREYHGRFDAIWLRSQPIETEAALRRSGWRRHDFPAPLGWYIDREHRLPVQKWYVTPGESE